MNNFSGRNRNQMFEELSTLTLDLIVIGGGITGAGIALDASSRGMKVALFEMQDFSAGTSSRSTKLIHGGLRYLKQLEVKVVAEVGRERAIVYENGPHVTTPEWMLLPLYKQGTFNRFTTAIGLTVYDFLAQVKKNERKKMLTKAEVLAMEPLIKQEGLLGGGYYVEYKTDDARLTIEVVKKAVELGALPFNYCKVNELLYNKEGKVIGVHVQDLNTGVNYVVHAKKVINATGPWVDQIRELDQSKRGKTLRLTKGVHVIFDQSRFPLKQAVYFDTPDGRMCFAIPRGDKTYFGTTDTNYNGDITNPVMSQDDAKYLLEAVNFIFPSLKLTVNDIESSYAGLRPLIHQEGKDPSEVSRKDEIFVSESGLISIAGGKLTGYRKMAEDVVNKTIKLMKQEQQVVNIKSSNTKFIAMSGGNSGGSAHFKTYIESSTQLAHNHAIPTEIIKKLARKYGTNIEVMVRSTALAKQWSTEYNVDLETALMLVYGLEHEMVISIEDFLIRRSGYMLFDIAKAKLLVEPVSFMMMEFLGWDEQRRLVEVEVMNKKLEETKL